MKAKLKKCMFLIAKLRRYLSLLLVRCKCLPFSLK
ncbi:hypothetical protein GLYMA_17G153250v4 [Glycine max]|nr:hypothetical protein GLYMA_17G153250v4 [Glycine max]KAH1118573.1 hypothetical protein GYH30_047368 [Glycine max]